MWGQRISIAFAIICIMYLIRMVNVQNNENKEFKEFWGDLMSDDNDSLLADDVPLTYETFAYDDEDALHIEDEYDLDELTYGEDGFIEDATLKITTMKRGREDVKPDDKGNVTIEFLLALVAAVKSSTLYGTDDILFAYSNKNLVRFAYWVDVGLVAVLLSWGIWELWELYKR